MSEEHPEKALDPIDFNEDGSFIVVKNVHQQKAQFPIDVTDDEILTLIREEQPRNA